MGRRYRRRKKLQLDFVQCILMVVLGLLMGTVFSVGMSCWNQAIAREDALAITATYEGYKFDYGNSIRWGRTSGKNLREIDLFFTDIGELSIDSSCSSAALRAALDTLQTGDELSLLVHPNGHAIVGITAGAETILDFDHAIKRLSGERWGFFCLGLVCYGFAGVGAYYILRRKYY